MFWIHKINFNKFKRTGINYPFESYQYDENKSAFDKKIEFKDKESLLKKKEEDFKKKEHSIKLIKEDTERLFKKAQEEKDDAKIILNNSIFLKEGYIGNDISSFENLSVFLKQLQFLQTYFL